MPTYGYLCPHCQTEFEVLQRMTDEAGADCPQCGTAGRRLFFPTGIVFKGSGFYKTDSRRAASASVNGGGPASGDKASSDGKPAPDGEKSSTGEKTSTGEKASAGEKPSGAKETATGGPAASGTSTST